MLRDRHEPVDLFALVPPLDLEFEPQRAQLDELLDDDPIVARVRDDLGRRSPRTRVHRRRATPVEVILRMRVVMRLEGWRFETAESFVNDSLVLRPFCRVDLEKVPDDTTLIRGAKRVGPETLQVLNDRAVERARGRPVTRGRRRRVDTTAVETEIHDRTDSGLIGDGVRVVSRRLRRARAVLGAAATPLGGAFRSRVRTVRRLSPQLHRIARRTGPQGREPLEAADTKRSATAERTGAQGPRVREALKRSGRKGAEPLAERFGAFRPRLTQGIEPARRRVRRGSRCRPGTRCSGCSSRTPSSSPASRPARRWSSAARSGSTRSRAGSSAGRRSGSGAAGRTSRISRTAWRHIGDTAVVPRTCGRRTAGCPRPRTRSWPKRRGSSRWRCRGWTRRRRSGRSGRRGVGSGGGIDSGRGSRAGSTCSDVISA